MDSFCISEKECADKNLKQKVEPPFIPFNGTCQKGCPERFRVNFTSNGEAFCAPTVGRSMKICRDTKIIDSVAAAQTYKGCNVIEGPLEIQIKSSNSNSKIVKVLEESLSDVEEIFDFLKIVRSFPIVSFNFLRNLKVIRGRRMESGKYSVVIWDNQNLQHIFNDDQKVKIHSGKLFFHFNPKLCFQQIEVFSNNSGASIENLDIAKMSNGNKVACNVALLDPKVPQILSNAAMISWEKLVVEDERSLLNYVIYYKEDPYTNVTLWEGRDACDGDE